MTRAAIFAAAVMVGLILGLALTNALARAADATVNPMMEY